MNTELRAKEANSSENWDKIWRKEGKTSWRGQALSKVYDRICKLVPDRSNIIDIGGGAGILGKELADKKTCYVEVWDQSKEALAIADSYGLFTRVCNLEALNFCAHSEFSFTMTEVLEHLTPAAQHSVLQTISAGKYAFISVPNNRLGPNEESQHTCKFTALEFKEYLLKYFQYVRVEVIDGYLLGVCGFKKNFTLSVTLPTRDEEKDVAATLASFRGVADEIIVGVDPRSTDLTYEIAKQYAEKVFYLDSPQGPPDDRMSDTGVHFAWCRNQCIDKCSGDWIFMTEGHERLIAGEDALLSLDKVMSVGAKVGYVLRTGQGQRWGFPWLQANEPKLRYSRSTHNILDIPEGTGVIKLPQIITLHDRHADRAKSRSTQRKSQNRHDLLDDWVVNQNENSLFYLGQEWRNYDAIRSINYFKRFVATSNNGPSKYQAKLILAKMLAPTNLEEARTILLSAVADDWTRIEHWIWLGDIAFTREQYEEALQFYRYASTCVGEPPFTLWWIDLSMYSYLTAQRLAMCYHEINKFPESLHWAKKVLELLPSDAPSELFKEAEDNIAILTKACEETND